MHCTGQSVKFKKKANINIQRECRYAASYRGLLLPWSWILPWQRPPTWWLARVALQMTPTNIHTTRLRTILVLGDICRYWIVLLLGDIVFAETPNTIPIRQQSAPMHHPHDNHLDICGAAVVSRRWQGEWGGVDASYTSSSSYSCVTLLGIVLYIFHLRSIHCYATVSLEANIIGYWVPCLVSF